MKNTSKVLLGGSLALVLLAGLGYFYIVRPSLVLAPAGAEVFVKNTGKTQATVYQVEAFWYFDNQVFLLRGLPEIQKKIPGRSEPTRLGLAPFPSPIGAMGEQGPCFMKVVVFYYRPGLPLLRYRALFHFEYDWRHDEWIPVEEIPPKFRALGNVAVGDIGRIDLRQIRDNE